jgi:hypothetical protein
MGEWRSGCESLAHTPIHPFAHSFSTEEEMNNTRNIATKKILALMRR